MTVVNRIVKPPGGDSFADVLRWNEGSDIDLPDYIIGSTGKRCTKKLSQKPFESQVTLEHPEVQLKLSDADVAPSSSGGIFTPSDETERPSVRLHQPAGGRSQILFGDDDYLPTKAVCPQKLTDLMGSIALGDEQPAEEPRKPLCQAKIRDMYGSISIYGDEEVEEPVKTSVTVSHCPGGESHISFGGPEPLSPPKRRTSERKVLDLMGRGAMEPAESGREHLSAAKKRELQGQDIFADGKLNIRNSLVVRQPPGGGSTIALT
eukprot:TRINITY_DN4430_c0_g1_i1.p1 TRINITY_DN4430_c0_g1~~TRINITY_DN4430_c0_g1_i1.p1  ORF type:complete len:263 (-),score=7.28 TRINITY_DN4430_c0_g1_i1:285-1073(-)